MFGRWNWRCYLAVGVIGGCIASVHAVANNLPKRHVNYFDLPSQALQISLIEFGLQAGVTIVADNRLLEGQRSSPIVGPHNIESALGNLLSATRLTYRFDEATNTYIIQLDPAAEKIAAEPIGSPSATVPTEPVIEELLVKSTRYPFRYQTVTNSQMLGDLPYFDSSRFINLLPGALIEDLQPKEVGDLLKYASSITPGDGLADSNDDVFVRGFQRSAMYVDGFRLSDATGVKLIPASIERAEILKGPSTLLFGQAEPGGIVNVVRKKPKNEQFLNTEVGVGTYGRQFINVDANSPIINDLLDARVIVVDETQDKSADISSIHRQFFAPSAMFHFTPETQISVAYEYQCDSRVLLNHVPVFMLGNSLSDIVYLDEVAKTARPDFMAESDFLNIALSHYLSDSWQLSAQYFWRDEERFGVRSNNDNLIKSNALYKAGELGNDFILYSLASRISIPVILNVDVEEPFFEVGEVRSIYDEHGFETNNNMKLRVDGTLEFAEMVHHLSFGGEWYQQDIFKHYDIEMRDVFPNRTWTPEKFNEEFADIIREIVSPDQARGRIESYDSRLLYDDYGVFAQDVIELNDSWLLTAGGRYSYLEGEHINVTEGDTTSLQTYEYFSSQLGIVYKPSGTQSIYTSYSEALRANYHLDDVGSRRAEPELSDQFEFGVKSLLNDGRLMTSMSVFEINKYNVVDIQILEGIRTSLVGVDQRVRGVDLDMTYQVSEEFDVLVGVSRLYPKITSGFNRGNRPALAAGSTVSIFGNYRYPNAMEVSGGVKYVSGRYADNTNRIKFDSYMTVDFSLSREENVSNKEVEWRLSVTNLLDEEYFTAATMGANVNFAEGRAIVGSVQVGW